MLNLLIDGYNLLYVLEKGLLRSLEEKRTELLRKLQKYQSQKDLEVTVVFDSSFDSPDLLRRDRFANIEIVFTDPKTSADDYIREACEETPSHFVVVSSDREILAAAAATNSLSISSEEFSSKLHAVDLSALENPFLEDKEDTGPIYPKISTKKKGAAKKLPKRERRKQTALRNL